MLLLLSVDVSENTDSFLDIFLSPPPETAALAWFSDADSPEDSEYKDSLLLLSSFCMWSPLSESSVEVSLNSDSRFLSRLTPDPVGGSWYEGGMGPSPTPKFPSWSELARAPLIMPGFLDC